MKMLGIVQDVRDASYDGKRGHVDALQVNVVEIGPDSYAGVVGVKVPKTDKEPLTCGQQVEVIIRVIRGTFSGVVMCDGTVKALKSVSGK